MKRITLSIILGLFLPFVCFMAIGITADYLTLSSWTEIKFLKQPAFGILLAPFSLSIYLDIYLQEKRIVPFIFDTLLFRLSSLILFNWVVYGILIYFVLGRFSRFGKTGKTIFGKPAFAAKV